jgi:ssRNA-specific RNase YbeY (16S rRNA maturation enzyme)
MEVRTVTRQQKQALKQRQSTRQLMGITQLTDHGVKTAGGELVFYLIQPDNLSVLSEEGVRQRVLALSNLLRSSTELTLVALDSRESFQRNKDYYRQRLEEETVPAIRELLRLDMEHLDSIQAGTASAREFAILFKLDTQTAADPTQLAQLERRIHSHGFRVRLADEQDIKRILAVYYQQDAVTDTFQDFDGEGMVIDHG